MSHQSDSQSRNKKAVVYREAISARTLTDMAGHALSLTNFPDGPLHDDPILKGRMNNQDCHANLRIHATDIIEVKNHEAKAIINPAITCSLILQGKAEGTIGGQPYCLDGTNGPTGYIWAMNEPMLWTRSIRKASHVRKVNIRIDRDWLLQEVQANPEDELCCFLRSLTEHPVNIQKWQPSKRALSLAEQLLQPSTASPFLEKMKNESKALDLLGEAFLSLQTSTLKPEMAQTVDKAQLIRSYIENNITSPLDLKTIARGVGMAINTMQRTFKQSYHMTVMDYLRERRLETAKEAMIHDGLTIAQAAFKAGYTSPSNFATAFKRVYGVSPSQIRN